jgi:hypothetical protein
MRMVICLRILSPSYWMCIMSVMVGRYKYGRLNLVHAPSRLEVEIANASWESINRQVVIKFRQNWFRQGAKFYCLRSTNSLILFGIRKNCLISGRSLLVYQFTERVTKLTVIIIVGYYCYELHTKFCWISFSQG